MARWVSSTGNDCILNQKLRLRKWYIYVFWYIDIQIYCGNIMQLPTTYTTCFLFFSSISLFYANFPIYFNDSEHLALFPAEYQQELKHMDRNIGTKWMKMTYTTLIFYFSFLLFFFAFVCLFSFPLYYFIYLKM